MKCKVYLRVAKNSGPRTTSVPFKVHASVRPNYKPLMSGTGYNEQPSPTAAFALELDIPDEVFRHAEQTLAEIELRSDDVRVAAEVSEDA